MVKRPKVKQDENGTYLHNGASKKAGLNKSILDAGWASFIPKFGPKKWQGSHKSRRACQRHSEVPYLMETTSVVEH
jgi:hypothetical protein